MEAPLLQCTIDKVLLSDFCGQKVKDGENSWKNASSVWRHPCCPQKRVRLGGVIQNQKNNLPLNAFSTVRCAEDGNKGLKKIKFVFPCHIISLSPSGHTGTKDHPTPPTPTPPKASEKPGRTRKQNNYVRGSSDRLMEKRCISRCDSAVG